MPTGQPEAQLEARLGYRFVEGAHLRLALTHKSHSNEAHKNPLENNERLEFLGDAILDFVVSDLLMAQYPNEPEGNLSKLRAGLVSEGALAEIARELGLGACLLMGRGEALSGGREKDSILANALEAVIAAVYVDSRAGHGYAKAFAVVRGLFAGRLAAAQGQGRHRDYKTELQELTQKHHKAVVSYQVLAEEGPDHEKQYRVGVYLRGLLLGEGQGRTKKQAEQAAAQAAMNNVTSGDSRG